MQQIAQRARHCDGRASGAVDALIIGAGPVGLFGAYYAGFRGLTVAVLDSLPEPGGQVAALYPDKQILDVAAHPTITGRELVTALLAQANAFAPTYLLGDSAARLSVSELGDEQVFEVETVTGRHVVCRSIVIAGGIGTFNPRRLPAAEQWQGAGVDYTVRALEAYAGKRVVVVGGGDTAVDWALALSRAGAAVTLVHRTVRFRAHAASLEQLQCSAVQVRTNAIVTQIVGGSEVDGVVVRDLDGERTEACDVVIPALGYIADLKCFVGWGLAMSERRITVDSAMRTSRDGIYAAGDIVDYPGKVRLIAVGFGEVAIAVNNAANAIYPDLPVFPGHSTDRSAGERSHAKGA